MTKPTKWCAPSEDSDQPRHLPSQIRVFTVRSIGKGPMFLHADSEDWSGWASAWSDQPGHLPSQIRVFTVRSIGKGPMFLHADSEDWSGWASVWVFAGRTGHFVGLVMRRLIPQNEHCNPAYSWMYICRQKCHLLTLEPLHEKTCLATRYDSNWPAQLQKPANVLKLWL